MSHEIMQQALDALKYHTKHTYPFHLTNVAIEALQKALAQPEQEPVAWMEDSIEFYAKDHPTNSCTIPLYTAPLRKEWVSLSDKDIKNVWDEIKDAVCLDHKTFAHAIEAKLKELNT
jgi:hypothetical protein